MYQSNWWKIPRKIRTSLSSSKARPNIRRKALIMCPGFWGLRNRIRLKVLSIWV